MWRIYVLLSCNSSVRSSLQLRRKKRFHVSVHLGCAEANASFFFHCLKQVTRRITMGVVAICGCLLAVFLVVNAAPDRVGRVGQGLPRAPRPAPYILNNSRPRANESRQDQGGACRDDPWQLPSIPRLSEPPAAHGRHAVINPPPQPVQQHQAASRWSNGAQPALNCRPAQRGPPRAPQAAVAVDDRRFITSAPEVHLPNIQRRFFSPQQAAPRRPTPKKSANVKILRQGVRLHTTPGNNISATESSLWGTGLRAKPGLGQRHLLRASLQTKK